MIVAFAATVPPSAAAPALAQDARDRTDGAAPADACADADLEDDRGIVVGTVRDAASGVVLPGTRVRLVPVPAVRRAGSAREAASRALEMIADPAGRFRFCAVPPGRYVAGAKLAGADEGSEWAIVRPEETTILELSLDLADTEPATEHGRVLARVVDGVEGGPVAAAAVRAGESGRTRLTDERGRVALDAAPAGTTTVRVTHAAFEPVETDVPVEANALVELEVTLGPVELEPIDVVATRRGPLADVYWRMGRGSGGRFITAEEIEKRIPRRVTDVLRTQPGFRVTPRMTGVEGELMNVRTACAPEVFLDGVKVTHSDIVDPIDSASRPPVAAYRAANVVVPTDIEIIEVYTGPAVLPAGLSTRGFCGVIAIWTKRGP